MRLIDLNPVWLESARGLTFFCPCCQRVRLTCFTAPTPFRDQVRLMHAALGTVPEDEDDWSINWVPAGAAARWALSSSTDFDSLTITPSIDASASGHWHGFIEAGKIK